MTEPAPGSVFVAGATVSVGATATDVNTTVDPLGRVTKAEFYDGATHLYTDTSPPYQYDWTKPPAGIRTLQAVATDTYGLQRTSAVVSVVVSYRPTVALTFPTNGAVFGAPTHLPLVATASDPDDTVQQVAFYSGGERHGFHDRERGVLRRRNSCRHRNGGSVYDLLEHPGGRYTCAVGGS